MITNKELLSSLLKTTQMGQMGIRSCLSAPMGPGLREELQSQLREYDSIETEAHAIASRRGWETKELDPAIRFMTDSMTKLRLRHGDTQGKIAKMMILGNTRGMVKSLKNLHQFSQEDPALRTLSRKLLDCETANVRSLKEYL